MVRRRVGFGSAVLHQEDHYMHIASIGMDLGKTTFHLVALGERNKVLVRKKFSRATLLTYTANLPASLIGLEACAGAHFLGSALRAQGHQVRLMPAQFVKPYRKSEQERLHRWGSDSRSRDPAEHALCTDQNAGATRLAGHAPCARPTDAASHGADQGDPRIPAGTRPHLRGAAHLPRARTDQPLWKMPSRT